MTDVMTTTNVSSTPTSPLGPQMAFSEGSSSGGIIQFNDSAKLVDYLMGDLRALSTDAKKKHSHIKEAAESGLVKIRNISAALSLEHFDQQQLQQTQLQQQSSSSDLVQALRASCAEVLHPFLLGCSSKTPRLVNISLQAIQRLIHHRAIDASVVASIVNELWQLTDAECEELKIIQTITPFVGTELYVSNWALSKCIVLTFRLNASKDSSVVNAASAAIRQLFSCVFERVIQEDEADGNSSETPNQHQKQQQISQQQQSFAPPSLRPAAADAFLLLRDLCALIRREQPSWLIGVQRIAPILGLELLESVVKNYPSIFFKHSEFAELLKTQISAQIAAKMLHVGEREFAMLAAAVEQNSGGREESGQNRPLAMSAQQLLVEHYSALQIMSGRAAAVAAAASSTSGRDFPIVIRSLRISLALVSNYHSLLGAQSEAILHFLMELLAQNASTSWEAAVAIEVLHKMLAQRKLLSWLCARPDGPKFLEVMVFSRLLAFTKKCLEEASHEGSVLREGENAAGTGFLYKGVFLPLDESQLSFSTAKRSILLDWLDKHHAEKIPEAYCLSLAFATLCVATRSLQAAIEQEENEGSGTDGGEQQKMVEKYSDSSKELYHASYRYLTAGLAMLLEASVDDSLNEQLLNCLHILTVLALRLLLVEAKRETLKTLCRATLPFQYYNKYIESVSVSNNSSHSAPNGTLVAASKTAPTTTMAASILASSSPMTDGVAGLVEPAAPSTQKTLEQTHNIVAMGTVCPSPYLPSHHFNTTVMLTSKNLQVLRVLVNCAIANGSLLGDCWAMTLTAIQHFVWIIGLRPAPTAIFRPAGTGNTGAELSTTSAPLFSLDTASNAPSNVTTTAASGAAASATTVSSGIAGATTVILTTMASSELPDIQLNTIFESTAHLDEVSLHHVIAALCKLSNDAMTVAQHSSRETSSFSIAKLRQTALVNLPRLHVFWRPVTAHLLELCSHSNASIREWGSLSLTRLVEEAMKRTVAGQHMNEEEITKREHMILSPLCAMNEISFSDVRSKQLDCLMKILLTDSRPLETPLWPFIVQIVRAVVAAEAQIADPQLIDQGFRALSLMVKEFLSVLPFECVEMLIDTDALYGQQQLHLNVSLASIGQLWDISDFVRRETTKTTTKDCSNNEQSTATKTAHSKAEVDQIWLLIYQALSNLCADPRPPVRKSACDTLLQTVAAHGQALNINCWGKMLTEILFPMLSRVHKLTQTASTQRSNTTNSLGAPNLMIHHSRDTESKQWAETSVKTLGGVVKIFNAHRPSLQLLENFAECWTQLLRRIVLAARADSAEISLSAVKNFQELLFGRQQQQQQSMPDSSNVSFVVGGSGSSKAGKQHYNNRNDPHLWMDSWTYWLKIAQAILSPEILPVDDFSDAAVSVAAATIATKKTYIPGLYHLHTLLDTFLWLFHRVRQQIPVNDIRLSCLGQIFIDIAAVPVSADQIPLSAILNNRENPSADQHQQLNMAQECLLSCARAVIQEQIQTKSGGNNNIRAALPDMLRLLISWMQFAWQAQNNKFCTQLNSIELAGVNDSNLVAFGEASMKMLLEFYTKTATFEEIVQQTVLIEIVKKLSEPLELKYRCPAQSTWQLAAATLNKICQVGIPIARENVNLFKQLWPCLASTAEKFLFCTTKSSIPLNADERKRHEFIDCLLVELLRAELLPYAHRLPRDSMHSIIELLNRGSINTMDANDVLDLHEQRTDFSRVCFNALLSLSQMEDATAKTNTATATTTKFQQTSPSTNPHSPLLKRSEGFLRNTTSQSQHAAATSQSLGATAITSLLNRCKQVLNNFARDEQRCGRNFPLPQERVFEAISALRAVSALVEGFDRNPTPALYSHLVTLHPHLVQLIPSSRSDQQVELSLMTCLNSYQTLLLLNFQLHQQQQ